MTGVRPEGTDATKTVPAKKRYDRDRWLQAALNVMAEKGEAALKIDSIAARLHVTKGSFYHHFRNRAEFVEALGKYWSSNFTETVVREIGASSGDGRVRLLNLMKLVWREDLDRFDIAFRSWAAQDENVARIVEQVDADRYRFIRSLFSEMGFVGTELETRVRVWMVFASAKQSLHLPVAGEGDAPTLEDYYRFFVE